MKNPAHVETRKFDQSRIRMRQCHINRKLIQSGYLQIGNLEAITAWLVLQKSERVEMQIGGAHRREFDGLSIRRNGYVPNSPEMAIRLSRNPIS